MNPIPAEILIPHRPPMVFIDSLVEAEKGFARATMTFPDGHFAVSDGRVLEPALVECIAQTMAALKAYGLPHLVGPPGMLAGAADFAVHRAPRAGEPLEIEVRELKTLGPMAIVHGRISSGAETLAEGELKLYG